MSRGVGMRAPLPRNGLGPAGARRRAHMDREEEEGRVAPGECGSYLARRPPPPLFASNGRSLVAVGDGNGDGDLARVVGGMERRMSSPAARSPSSAPPPPPPTAARSSEKMGMRTVGAGGWGKWGSGCWGEEEEDELARRPLAVFRASACASASAARSLVGENGDEDRWAGGLGKISKKIARDGARTGDLTLSGLSS